MKYKLKKEFPADFSFGGLPAFYLKLKVGDEFEADDLESKVDAYVSKSVSKKSSKPKIEEIEE